MTEVFITCNFRSKETRRSCCMSWTPCRQSSRSATCHPQGKNILSKEKNILYNTAAVQITKGEGGRIHWHWQREGEIWETSGDKIKLHWILPTSFHLSGNKLNCATKQVSPYLWLWLSSVSALSPDINSDICVTPLWDLTGASEDWQCPTSYLFCFSLRTQCASFLVE